ncbi:hypothetical protein CROQUDRAFT_90447 [Cronartium quercuum f. sp. fusiforme G11]|uniref:Uncharacterized protein n=1 Tax=Cronartium quercuum f. sp. fusiforme G11 TaxID=708437 RepID=A0A9P6NJS2_9BASI|nr:hypothetical protein CROQUDRAFT_90447 [Cronartium quercuum f. sp. fusiforme G11]
MDYHQTSSLLHLVLIQQTPSGLTLHPKRHILLHLSSLTVQLQTHPFISLIDHEKAEFEAKKARESNKSLKECVQEYKQRYGQHPISGFHCWYEYAIGNSSQSIDESDQPMRDLAPFWELEMGRLSFEHNLRLS